MNDQKIKRQIIVKILSNNPKYMEIPNCIPYIMNELLKNEQLNSVFNERNPSNYISRVSDIRFLDLLYNKYVSENKRDNERETNIDNEKSNYSHNNDNYKTDNNNNNNDISSLNNMQWLFKDKDKNNINNDNDNKPLNILPLIDDIYYIDYNLILDFVRDLAVDRKDSLNTAEYKFGFTEFGNISKISINNINLPYSKSLYDLPYILVKISEIKGRFYDSKKNNYFGKLILKNDNINNKMLNYITDYESCYQYFYPAISLNNLTISFYSPSGELLNLQEIILDEIIIDENNKIEIKSKNIHNLSINDSVVIYIIKNDIIEVLENSVCNIIDEYKFNIEYSEYLKNNESLSIELYKRYLNANIMFKLNEINYNMISNKDKTKIELVQLTELIKKSNKLL